MRLRLYGRMSMLRKDWGLAWLLAGVIVIVAHSQSAGTTATIVTDRAPVLLLPDRSRVPLANLPAGTTVRVLATEGEWLNIDFQDARFGRRIGYVLKEHVKVEESTAAREFAERLTGARAAAASKASTSESTQEPTGLSAGACRRIDCISGTILMNARPPTLVNPRVSEAIDRHGR